MPPHCDSMDGPVVKAAIRALQEGNVKIILPFVPEDDEDEVRTAFNNVTAVRQAGGGAAEIADEWFFETVVRLHRAGEGAAFTGLKPAGLGHGPIVPVAEEAVESGDMSAVSELLTNALRDAVQSKFSHVQRLGEYDQDSVAEAREYTEAMLGFLVWSHKTLQCIQSDPLHHHE